MTAGDMTILAEKTISPGFADPAIDSQRVFRAMLEAMARPGTIVDVPAAVEAPAPLDAATAALLLMLVDHDTPVWFDPAAGSAAALAWVRFHCGSPVAAAPEGAAFAVIADPVAMPPLGAFHAGSDEYPDRSATLIVQVPSLAAGAPWRLEGPGIRDHAVLAVAGIPPVFTDWVRANHDLFPRGVDLVFASGTRIAALPRSTRLGGG